MQGSKITYFAQNTKEPWVQPLIIIPVCTYYDEAMLAFIRRSANRNPMTFFWKSTRAILDGDTVNVSQVTAASRLMEVIGTLAGNSPLILNAPQEAYADSAT